MSSQQFVFVNLAESKAAHETVDRIKGIKLGVGSRLTSFALTSKESFKTIADVNTLASLRAMDFPLPARDAKVTFVLADSVDYTGTPGFDEALALGIINLRLDVRKNNRVLVGTHRRYMEELVRLLQRDDFNPDAEPTTPAERLRHMAYNIQTPLRLQAHGERSGTFKLDDVVSKLVYYMSEGWFPGQYKQQ